MTYRARAVAALFAGLAFLPAPAIPQGIVVEGTVDCGEWITARSNNTAVPLEHYLLGLLNGLALGRQDEFWRADGRSKPSREAIYLWMDKYCRDNPLSNPVSGAFVLFDERAPKRP